MSQQPMEQQDATGIPGEEDHFAEGLAAALKDDEQPQDSSQHPEDAGESTHHEAAPQGVPAGIEAPEAAPMPQEPPVPSPAGTPQQTAEEKKAEPEAAPAQPAAVKLPEELQAEYERLQEMDPEAAKMALEDSPAGQAVRHRLEQYGAELAYDHASLVMMRRQQDTEREAMRQEQARQAVTARQQHFLQVMKQDHPDFHALLTGGDQAAQMRFRNDVLQWIQAKPYAEAAPLMDIFTNSQDPQEVGSLLAKFKNERNARRPDPTGALAVPGRGGTVAPAGIGDKDDFDAGLSLSLSSK